MTTDRPNHHHHHQIRTERDPSRPLERLIKEEGMIQAENRSGNGWGLDNDEAQTRFGPGFGNNG